MKLLTAIIIFFGDDPQMISKVKEAYKVVRKEEIRADSILCRETIKKLNEVLEANQKRIEENKKVLGE